MSRRRKRDLRERIRDLERRGTDDAVRIYVPLLDGDADSEPPAWSTSGICGLDLTVTEDDQ
ncbi:hypothetical protein [Natrinema sp. SYSU A 869]|uniref:hypothetical protein n=1 Tax=Natrinema sp. SYSU A 869 TaxID=2871694 RepID=UPI001CA3C3BC|nr:hypothetical protein [Natrinema sp. SYSU A 869]